jgi:UDP-glucose 4-epimerase
VRLDRSESPYAASKMAGEALCHAYSHCYGVHHVIFRFSNVYGRFDDSIRVVPLFIRLARANQKLTVFGREKAYDMTYIDDAVDGIYRALTRFDAVQDQTFNIATGNATRLADVAKWIVNELDSQSSISFAPMRTGEIRFHCADISKARRLLGYIPKRGVRDGISRAVRWYQKHRP